MDRGATGVGAALSALAPAKINLALHVTGRRADGYHELESLVVFAADGDRVSIAPSETDRLTVDGPFADNLPTGRHNIVLRALDKARETAVRHGREISPLHIHLEKNLPHASGIGGGSADAAALLRLLAATQPGLLADLRRDAVALGADVPMCIDGFAAKVRGIGEIGARVAGMPELPMLLVNPGIPVSTPAAFAALECRDNPGLAPMPADGFSSLDALTRFLVATRNDLERPALTLAPVIGEAVAALREAGALFARMSGSGATVFGLFETRAAVEGAARALSGRRPGWWVQATHCPAVGALP